MAAKTSVDGVVLNGKRKQEQDVGDSKYKVDYSLSPLVIA